MTKPAIQSARSAYLGRERPGELAKVDTKPKPKPKPVEKPVVRRGPYYLARNAAPEPPMLRAPTAPERSPGGAGIHCPFRHDGELWYFTTWEARVEHLRGDHGWT